MGCVYSVVCRRNSRLAVFGSEYAFERAWTEQQTLLHHGLHPMAELQSDFTKLGSANFVFRMHEDSIENEDLQDEVDDYIVRMGAFAAHQGYHVDRADLVPAAPPPTKVIAGPPEDPAVAQLKAANEAMAAELRQIREMLAAQIKGDELVEEVAAEPPKPVQTVERVPSKKSNLKASKPVVRVENGLKSGRFPSISAAAKAAKTTQRDLRAAIRKKSLLKGAIWAFESEVTPA